MKVVCLANAAEEVATATDLAGRGKQAKCEVFLEVDAVGLGT